MGITSGRRDDRRVGPAKVMTAADVMESKAKAAQAVADGHSRELQEFREMYRQELIIFGQLFGEGKKTLEALPPEELRDRVHELLQTSAVELTELRKAPSKTKKR